MPNIKLVKQQAWEYYQKWRKETTYCPALKCNVQVSLQGWSHLAGNLDARHRGKKRSINDSYRRLMLLPYAKEIIEKSTTIQNIVEKRGRRYYGLEAIVMVSKDGAEVPRKVRVVLIEGAAGSKIFYSVMDKRQSSLAFMCRPHA